MKTLGHRLDSPLTPKMPSKLAIIQLRLENIVTCLNGAVTTVELVSKNLKTPFLEPIVNTVCSLLNAAQVIICDPDITVVTEWSQTIKQNKEECVEMLEKIHQVLYAIIRVHMTSNTGGELTPKMLDNLGQFTEYVYDMTQPLVLITAVGHSTRSTPLWKLSRKKRDSRHFSARVT
jgi:hypothetical protein